MMSTTEIHVLQLQVTAINNNNEGCVSWLNMVGLLPILKFTVQLEKRAEDRLRPCSVHVTE